tara:strand:- start:420 stop:569 length:150 start_codon:yes stop_codon:yes gene_type:complete
MKTEFDYAVKKQEKLSRYKKGFRIMMQYFDSISDEQKAICLKELEEVGL